MKTLLGLILMATCLLTLGCGSPQKTLEGTWSATLTPTVGEAQALGFNMSVVKNPDSSLYVSNMSMTLSNSCLSTTADKTVTYNQSTKAMAMLIDGTNSSVSLDGSLDAIGDTVSGNYAINGSTEACQGGGMFTMTRLPNPGPTRRGN